MEAFCVILGSPQPFGVSWFELGRQLIRNDVALFRPYFVVIMVRSAVMFDEHPLALRQTPFLFRPGFAYRYTRPVVVLFRLRDVIRARAAVNLL